MAWRLHLTNHTIQQLDILSGTPPVLAIAARRDRVLYHHLISGTLMTGAVLEMPYSADFTSPEWAAFIQSMKAPNDRFISHIRDTIDVYLSSDGTKRLYSGEDKLYLYHGDTKRELTLADGILSLDLDHDGIRIAAVDRDSQLYLYTVGQESPDFTVKPLAQKFIAPQVIVTTRFIFIHDGQKIVRLTLDGDTEETFEAHYTLGLAACSASGKWLAIVDNDSGVIRVYKGEALRQTHQRFAIDLVEEAAQLQLIADLPPEFVSPSALAIDDNGTLAFAMSGVVCVTTLENMNILPTATPPKKEDKTDKADDDVASV